MKSCQYCGGIFATENVQLYTQWFNSHSVKQVGKFGFPLSMTQALADGPRHVLELCKPCFIDKLDSLLNYYAGAYGYLSRCDYCGRGSSFIVNPDYTIYKNEINLSTYPNNTTKLCNCCKENTKQCPSCYEVFNKNVFITKDGYCASCYPYNQFDVLPHNYSPEPYFNPKPRITSTVIRGAKARKADRRQNLYLGMEIEVTLAEINTYDGEDTERNFIAKVIGNQIHWNLYHNHNMPTVNSEYYFKHDGSVRPGFELVTHPMTPQYIKDHFSLRTILNSFSQVIPDISQYIAHHPACGLHIHASRAAMTRLQIYKIASFVYTNHENMSLIGGRSYNKYCQNDIKRGYDPHNGHELFRGFLAEQIKYRDQASKAFRYFMLNLIPRDTIEFRFFKSTLDAEIIYGYLELVVALIEWATLVPIGETRWSIFYEYITSKKKKYQYLLTLIQNVGVHKFYDVSDSVYGISKEKGDRGWVDALMKQKNPFADIVGGFIRNPVDDIFDRQVVYHQNDEVDPGDDDDYEEED